jgi:hypothetical protein
MRLVNKLLARLFRGAAGRFGRLADDLDPPPAVLEARSPAVVGTYFGRVAVFIGGASLFLSAAECRQLRRQLRRAEAEACGLTGLVGELAYEAGQG